MAITPLWLQNVDYPAQADRALFAELWDEGVLDLASFAVTQRAAGANMSVDVAVGRAVVTGDDQANQGNYLVTSDALINAAIGAAPGSNSRIDRVVLRINDPNAGGPAGDSATVAVIAGTAAASPVAPATPTSAISLATIGPIPVGTVAITTAMITDTRLLAGRRDTPGVMSLYTGAIAPNGWLEANGQAVSRTAQPRLNALYAAQGYPYGAGDGSTTFNVPDMRDRLPMAKGTTFPTVGAGGGASTKSLSAGAIPAHTHTIAAHTHTQPTHQHSINHNHPAGSTGLESSNHTHSMTHNHGSHQHQGYGNVVLDNKTDGATDYDVQSGAVYGFSSDGAWFTDLSPAISFTGDTLGVSINHFHSFDVADFAGSSGLAGGESTGGTALTTDSTGSGTAFDVMNPYRVLNMWIVRT